MHPFLLERLQYLLHETISPSTRPFLEQAPAIKPHFCDKGNQLKVASVTYLIAKRLRFRLVGVKVLLALVALVVFGGAGAVAHPRRIKAPAVTPVSAPSPFRVISLDNCADQYVLGLVPRSQILGLSTRSTLADSFYRDRATNIRQIRPSLETILALHPDVIVRTWGGDFALIQALKQHNIPVININDVTDYIQAGDELLRVGHLLGQDQMAKHEARSFDTALSHLEPSGNDRTVLYYTPSGFSAGPDTMVGHMLERLGFRLETRDKGYFPLPPEVLLSLKPDVFALGFYEDKFEMRRTPGRNPLVRRLIETHPRISIPSKDLACSGWYTAYDLQSLAQIDFTTATEGGKIQ